MDGENKGKPYFLMDDLGGKTTLFGNTRIHPAKNRSGRQNNQNSPEIMFQTVFFGGFLEVFWVQNFGVKIHPVDRMPIHQTNRLRP